jgi:predicted DCC family thiol-disulfide oxidoreductase YuxK
VARKPGLDADRGREYSQGRMLEARQENGLVFYDGLCGLCDRWVQFLLRRDPAQRLKFAPLQGETARQRNDLPAELRSVAFIVQPGTAQEKFFSRSEAALRLLDHVGGLWRLVSWLRIIPRPLRDWGYDLIARRRYRWFGKFESCRVPAPEFRTRFLP